MNLIVSNAHIGVSYFFILSGFIMIIAYNNKNINVLNYYKNRFARIYPMYIFALLLFLVITKNNNNEQIFYNVVGLQSWIPGFPLTLNTPGWSISVEIFFTAYFLLFFTFLKNILLKLLQ
ncbi:acyltransferase [Chryseobacterium sp. 3008163]|nr:acyltransferase [Chryseobacterium sp. 3008163]